MKYEEALSVIKSFDRERRLYYLCDLGVRLTISIRGAYSSTPQIVSSSVPGSFVGQLNEAQHRTLGLVQAILSESGAAPDSESLLRAAYKPTDCPEVQDEMRRNVVAALDAAAKAQFRGFEPRH